MLSLITFLGLIFLDSARGLLDPYRRVQFIQLHHLSDILQTPFMPAPTTPIKPLPTLDAHRPSLPIPLHFVDQIHNFCCNRFLHFFFNLVRRATPDLKNLSSLHSCLLSPSPTFVPAQIHNISPLINPQITILLPKFFPIQKPKNLPQQVNFSHQNSLTPQGSP